MQLKTKTTKFSIFHNFPGIDKLILLSIIDRMQKTTLSNDSANRLCKPPGKYPVNISTRSAWEVSKFEAWIHIPNIETGMDKQNRPTIANLLWFWGFSGFIKLLFVVNIFSCYVFRRIVIAYFHQIYTSFTERHLFHFLNTINFSSSGMSYHNILQLHI